VTQGGWGAPAHGNNPGTILDANFAAKFPSGAVIGDACGFKLTFTTAAAVRAFLPQGGTPRALTASDTPTTNPTKKFTVFAGQILALTINVAFSSPSGPFPDGLGSFVPFTTGPAAGKTVSQILADANKALAGCGINGYASISQINDIVTSINEMFD
jgi:hypothetical protein